VSHPVQFATLPTPAIDNGDFSAYGVPIENPDGAAHRTTLRPVFAALISERPPSLR
jgi:hypothetical protein